MTPNDRCCAGSGRSRREAVRNRGGRLLPTKADRRTSQERTLAVVKAARRPAEKRRSRHRIAAVRDSDKLAVVASETANVARKPEILIVVSAVGTHRANDNYLNVPIVVGQSVAVRPNSANLSRRRPDALPQATTLRARSRVGILITHSFDSVRSGKE